MLGNGKATKTDKTGELYLGACGDGQGTETTNETTNDA